MAKDFVAKKKASEKLFLINFDSVQEFVKIWTKKRIEIEKS